MIKLKPYFSNFYWSFIAAKHTLPQIETLFHLNESVLSHAESNLFRYSFWNPIFFYIASGKINALTGRYRVRATTEIARKFTIGNHMRDFSEYSLCVFITFAPFLVSLGSHS